tara:strand:+ start:84 stop:752 length:669 start_codon:yes stop_codon:yes gene_type:complete
MSVTKKNFESPTAFLDLLFNVMFLFVVLFLVSFLLINPVKKENTMEAKAEFIITFEWPNKSPDDVDAYVKDPLGNIVFYQAREVGLLHLDRDDLGHRNDTITMPDGTVITVEQNREVVSVRGIVPGEYIVNVHMWSMQNGVLDQETGSYAPGEPVEVTVRLDKINPTFRTVTKKTVVLKHTKDEKTAFRFTVGRDGEIIDLNELEQRIATNPANAGQLEEGG